MMKLLQDIIIIIVLRVDPILWILHSSHELAAERIPEL